MRELKECTGPWKGLWTQGMVRGSMSMLLRFQDHDIQGEGKDQDGPFTIWGVYDPTESRVFLRKHYPWLDVLYDGKWNGQFINGHSTIGPVEHGETGDFELWPETEELTIMGLLMTDEAVVSVPSASGDGF